MSLLIKGGLVVTATGSYVADVLAENGKIVAIGVDLGNTADEVVDARGKYVLPGAIDPHTHLCMPFMGTYAQDDYKSGTIAAACGGVTTVIDFQIQQKGESIRQGLNRKMALAEGMVAVDYSLHPAITDPRPEVIDEVKQAILEYGTPSFKIFMVYDFRVDDATMIKLLERTRKHGGLVQVHAENPHIIQHMNEKLEHEGKLAPYYHAVSRPNIAEEEAVERAARLAEFTGSRLYIVHLSSREGLAKVKEFRSRGIDIYAETCPQYLLLDEECYKEADFGGAKYVMSPPLRTRESNAALWGGLKAGDVQVMATDHCPFDFNGKKDMFGKDDYKKIPNGAPGIETLLPLLHSEGVVTGKISLEKMVDVLATSTARIFGLKDKGAIEVGKDADIVVFDPARKFTIAQDKLHMNVDYNPYENRDVTGMPEVVFSRGQRVAEWQNDRVEFVGVPGHGRFVKRVPLRD
ncbi:dihydropyrimidinase [Geopsychrobacter electrodiphilus]|uniref:dihydropyrimidinase n=1 Tax=Geopsychrobacter electrodiphilus TaxID=225196 RepID=UPI00037B204B|nr:dihydropyrimidinase [Geopsychrobacter electrodiphilus]